ncbi:ral guanine nucleotide dissociation stimulator-like isoform X2 [Dasypus novemcinctus]
MVKKIKADRVEKLVGQLVPAFQCGNFSFITNFLRNYRDLATTQQVLDLLFTKYGCILPYTKEDGGPLNQLKNAISFILSTWLHEFSEDFCQPPDFLALQVVVAYLQLNLPGSELEQFAQCLLTQHEQAEAIQAEAPAPVPEPGLQPDLELNFPAAPPLPPAPAPGAASGLEVAQISEASLESVVALAPAAAQELETEGVWLTPKPSPPLRDKRETLFQ